MEKHQSYVIPFATTYPINIVYHGKANLNMERMAFILASKIHSPF